MKIPGFFRRFGFWQYGVAITLLIGATVGYNLEFSNKTLFISGEPSHGHHQIEMACSSCHGDGFGGPAVMQQACVGCHGDELELADDSHPRKKFLDPRNAPLLANLDARQCVTCHTEHKPEITRDMGVTLAGDFCIHCHSDIAEDRPSHRDFAFDSCASCHNFHDNRSLYEDFLMTHLDEPDLLEKAQLPARTAVQDWLAENPETQPLQLQQADLPVGEETDIAEDWAHSTHARVAVNCSECHADGREQLTSLEITEQCGQCHRDQRESFSEGKHGMRLAAALAEDFTEGAMSPQLAQLPMKDDARGELNCASCHDPHRVDLVAAAVDACLNCHDDRHSLAYKDSPHFDAWQAEPDTGPSCAGCHLPREQHGDRILVNHNQNHNLRPNEKMLPVCLNCHGTELGLSSLIDETLIANNFSSEPASEHESFELIRQRLIEIAQKEKEKSTTDERVSN